MKTAIIITAESGIGLRLAEKSPQFNIKSKTHAVIQAGVCGMLDKQKEKVDHVTRIDQLSSPIESLSSEFDYLVWYTGVFLQKVFSETSDFEIDALIDLHYRVPLKIIRDLHKNMHRPYHLIVIASCSSWRLRHKEAIYCGLCAAKAAFARNFANDLIHERQGSKITLVNPGGLRTPFFYEDEIVNEEGYLDQNDLALFIWETAVSQSESFKEIQFLRNKSVLPHSAKPTIEFATRCPETI